MSIPTPAEYAKMLSEIDTAMQLLEARRQDIINAITAQFPADGTTHEGGLTVSPGVRRLNTALIEEKYPKETHPQYYTIKTVVDSKKLKRHLSEVELEEQGLYKIGEPRVSVKPMEQS